MISTHARGGKPPGTADTQQTPPGRAASCRDLWRSARTGQSPASTRGHSPLPGAVCLLRPPAVLQALLQGLPATQDGGPVSTPATHHLPRPPTPRARESALPPNVWPQTQGAERRGDTGQGSEHRGQRGPGRANPGRGPTSEAATDGAEIAGNNVRDTGCRKPRRAQFHEEQNQTAGGSEHRRDASELSEEAPSEAAEEPGALVPRAHPLSSIPSVGGTKTCF